jgi:hypothetical protein
MSKRVSLALDHGHRTKKQGPHLYLWFCGRWSCFAIWSGREKLLWEKETLPKETENIHEAYIECFARVPTMHLKIYVLK